MFKNSKIYKLIILINLEITKNLSILLQLVHMYYEIIEIILIQIFHSKTIKIKIKSSIYSNFKNRHNKQNYSYKKYNLHQSKTSMSKLNNITSSLPDIFRTMQLQANLGHYTSTITPSTTTNTRNIPIKQGGMYAIKYSTVHHEGYKNNNKDFYEQPQQYFSVGIFDRGGYGKSSESRIGTSHTIRSRNLTSAVNNRNLVSSQSQRKPSRKVSSRPSSRQVRSTNIFTNYGNPRVTFAIGQTVPLPFQQAQSLVHHLNKALQQTHKQQSQLQQLYGQKHQVQQSIKYLSHSIKQQLQQLQQTGQAQFKRLRNLLSQLRRNSGMDTKLNKTQVDQLKDGLTTIKDVLTDLQLDANQMYQHVLQTSTNNNQQ